MWSSLLSKERTFASTMVGIAGLFGLAASLARIPPRLPLFCFLSRRLWRLRSGRDAVVGVGDGVGLRSRPRSRSSSACAEFNSNNVVLPTSSRNSRLYACLKTRRICTKTLRLTGQKTRKHRSVGRERSRCVCCARRHLKKLF